MDVVLHDLRYGVRQLLKAPAFLSASIATLAIGIGATTALFSTVDATLLRPLPYPHPEQLIELRTRLTDGRVTTGLLSMGEITALNEIPRIRAAGVADQPFDATLVRDEGTPVRALVTGVSEEFFGVLGVPLMRGTGFRHEDFLRSGPNAPMALVVSYRAWTEMFGRDPAVVGRVVRIAEAPVVNTIVGIAGPELDLPHGTDFWFASRTDPHDISHGYEGILRLPAGVPIDRVRSEAAGAMAVLAKTVPADVNREYVMRSLLSSIVGDLGSTLLILFAATLLLLVLASVNVASLVLSRGVARMREIAVRSAVGAGRGQLVRQLSIEALLVAAAGTVLGVALAAVAVRLLLALGASSLPRLDTIPFDARVLLFTFGVLAVSTLIMGVVPAWRLAGTDLRILLNESGRTTTPGRGMTRLMSAMTVLEIALAIVLAAGAGWLVQSYARLAAVDPGFRSAGRLVVNVRPTKAFTREQALTWSEEVVDRVRGANGVATAGAARTFPFQPDQDTSIGVAFEDEPPRRVPHSTHIRLVTRGFFEAMGIPVLAGRTFTDDDRTGTLAAAVVNRAFVRALLGTRDPLGVRFKYGYPDINSATIQVVGVVGDVLYTSPRAAAEPTFYLVQAQAPFPIWRPAVVVVPRAGDPAGLIPAIRSALHEVDPQAIVDFETAPAIVAATLARQRLGMTLMLIFGATALVLAAVGIYGVVAYHSAQRRDEIATRLALGASGQRVFWLMMRSGQRLALTGTIVGVAAAYAGGRLLAANVYAMRATDPLVLVGAAFVVAVMTFAAVTIPAVRASRLDPVHALRRPEGR